MGFEFDPSVAGGGWLLAK